jgi:hypothetical protein
MSTIERSCPKTHKGIKRRLDLFRPNENRLGSHRESKYRSTAEDG